MHSATSHERPRKRANIIKRPGSRILSISLAAALAGGIPALAAPSPAPDQRYVVAGNDVYRVGSGTAATTITYAGTQRLWIRRTGKTTRFVASVRYVRSDPSGKETAQASFVQEMMPSGDLHDRTDLDPDYLTVLNQPFAIELDPTTLRDLLRLAGRVPFDFPSPITGGALHGYLQRAGIARVDAKPVIGITFDASGPMLGPLPGHPLMSIRGRMRMQGTAYYALHGALLLALSERLTIDGKISDPKDATPVRIVYVRTIKANDSKPAMTEACTSVHERP